MKKILLCCSAGMSTSMLVKKMEQSAQSRGIECEIQASQYPILMMRLVTSMYVYWGLRSDFSLKS